MTTTTQTIEDLEQTARVIEEQGWIQGRMKASDGRVCLLGAIREVTEVRGLFPHAHEPRIASIIQAVSRQVGEDAPHMRITVPTPPSVRLGQIAEWNDRVAKTQEQVVRLLWKAQRTLLDEVEEPA